MPPGRPVEMEGERHVAEVGLHLDDTGADRPNVVVPRCGQRPERAAEPERARAVDDLEVAAVVVEDERAARVSA